MRGYTIVFAADSKGEADYIVKQIPYKTKIVRNKILFGFEWEIFVPSGVFPKVIKEYNFPKLSKEYKRKK